MESQQRAEETFMVRHVGTGPQVHDLIVARSAGKWLTPPIRRLDVGRRALLSTIATGHGISLKRPSNMTNAATDGAAVSR